MNRIRGPLAAALLSTSLLGTALVTAPAAQAAVPTCGGLTAAAAAAAGYVVFEDTVNADDSLALGGLAQQNWIMTNGGRDTVITGPLDDIICTGAKLDQVYAGDGDDFISLGAGGDFTRGEGGSDVIEGGDGTDTIWGDYEVAFDVSDGADIIHGGPDADDIEGGDQLDQLFGDGGADTLNGGLSLVGNDGFADVCVSGAATNC